MVWRRGLAQVLCAGMFLQGAPMVAFQETVARREAGNVGPATQWLQQSLAQVTEVTATASASVSRGLEAATEAAATGATALARWAGPESTQVVGQVAQHGPSADRPPTDRPTDGRTSNVAAARPLPTLPPTPPGFRPAVGLGAPSTSTGPHTVRLSKSTPTSISVTPGWNLSSLPWEPADTNPAAIFAALGTGLARVFAYDACDPADPWKLYDPADAGASDLSVLDHRPGFWLEALAPGAVPAGGVLPPTTTISLCPGWNLIGFPAAGPRPVATALASIDGSYTRVIAYDSNRPDRPWSVYDTTGPTWANSLTHLEPGRGYWVLATAAAELEIVAAASEVIAEIESPAELVEITAPTPVIATVGGDRLASWTLQVRAAGEANPRVLASGSGPATSAELASFDPTLLRNGLYELELLAEDTDGLILVESRSILVGGGMKIGHFSLAFVDLEVPLAGLPIQVVRAYDSRDADRLGDFGFGWRLEVRQGELRHNRPPGEGWQIVPLGHLPCQAIGETRSHLTTVRLSDREVYRFKLSLFSPATVLGGCYAKARFDFVDGPVPGARLEIVGNDDVVYLGGSVEVLDADTFETFEPRRVRLITRDGRRFELEASVGITSIEEPNGNTLTISASAISHSSGASIVLVRDNDGRVTEILDPAGEELRYEYDLSGDLVAFTDRTEQTTRFSYSAGHRLEGVEDPRGDQPIRNEFDATGRLLRHVDGFGNVIEYTHEIGARREVVTNRLGASRVLEYDTRGNVVREVGETGGVTLRSFDARDNLLSETDPLGNTSTFSYNAAGDLTTMTDPLGNTTSFSYDIAGRVLSTTDPRGQSTHQSYDSRGNLIASTDALGRLTSFAYDGSGNLVAESDALGQTTVHAYDGRGRLLQQIDPLGQVTNYAYDALGNQTSQSSTRTRADGTTELVTWLSTYDADGRLTSSTDPLGSTSTTVYDALGRVVSVVDALGRTSTMSYDELGRQIRTDHPDGTHETRGYDAEGRLTSTTDRGGRTTLTVYDAAGRVVETRWPDGAIRSQAYDTAGRVTSTTDELGHITRFEYDAAGRRTKVIDALGEETLFTFDAAGNHTSIVDARGNETSFAYDALGRVVATTYADGTSTAVAYDELGRRISETDQAGRTTAFGYDPLGRLVSVTDALGQVTAYTWDELGNRTSQTDANGHTTRFEYDSLGRQLARVFPDGSRESLGFDAVGNRISRTDFLGRTTTWTHDAANRAIGKVLPSGAVVGYSYTSTGQRASVTDSRGTTSWVYDQRDRVVSHAYPDARRLAYEHDAAGNRTRLTAHLAGGVELETSYAWDELGRLASVTDASGRTYQHGYDEVGNRVSLAHPNGVATSWAYDSQNRLARITATHTPTADAVTSFAYTLGPAGNRVRIDELGGVARHFGYDALSRLVSEEVRLGSDLAYRNNFAYDPVGNRLSQQRTPASGSVETVTSSYDSRDRLLAAGPTSYGWNAAGNLVARGGDSFGWDDEDRLIEAVLGDGTVVRYGYDDDGVRVRTETLDPTTGETSVVEHLVDTTGFLSHVVAETDADGQLLAHYVRGDDLLAVIRPIGTRFYHADGLGTIRALTDEGGAVTDRYDFEAFGTLIAHEGDDPNAYLFAGEPLDPNSRFAYHRARWMEPGVGRFASVDSWGGSAEVPGSQHRYSYASLEPVSTTDPTGLFSSGELGAALGSMTLMATRVTLAARQLYLVGVGALLMNAAGVGALTTWGSRISLGLSVLGAGASAINEANLWLETATRTLTANQTLIPNVPTDQRGLLIEQLTGANLGGNVRVIDDYRDGVGTSVKSYASFSNDPGVIRDRLITTISGHARTLGNSRGTNYTGVSQHGVPVFIPGSDVRELRLVVAVPENYRTFLLDPRFRAAMDRAAATSRIVIRVVPTRGWRR